MNLWERLQNIGLLKRSPQPDVAAECLRFQADQAFQQYVDEAKFQIITQLYALQENQVEEFQQLIRSKMALEGLTDFIDQAIISEKMKESRRQA